ncbi:MAG: hypothetical protein AAFR18_19095, partial [Cyanobacteria bacterium J06627_32]
MVLPKVKNSKRSNSWKGPLRSLRRMNLRSAIAWGLLALTITLTTQGLLISPANATVNRFCQISQAEAERKESLRVAGREGNTAAQQQYEALSRQH